MLHCLPGCWTIAAGPLHALLVAPRVPRIDVSAAAVSAATAVVCCAALLQLRWQLLSLELPASTCCNQPGQELLTSDTLVMHGHNRANQSNDEDLQHGVMAVDSG